MNNTMSDQKDKKVTLQLPSSSVKDENDEDRILENADILGLLPENNGIFSKNKNEIVALITDKSKKGKIGQRLFKIKREFDTHTNIFNLSELHGQLEEVVDNFKAMDMDEVIFFISKNIGHPLCGLRTSLPIYANCSSFHNVHSHVDDSILFKFYFGRPDFHL